VSEILPPENTRAARKKPMEIAGSPLKEALMPMTKVRRYEPKNSPKSPLIESFMGCVCVTVTFLKLTWKTHP